MYQPLADVLRPKTLDEVCGQEHILAPDGLLRRILASGSVPNMIFYGPSGTGKTTLFRILMGLETPDSGTIDGLKNLKISAVFQEDRLLEGYDVLTNLRFVCRQRLSDAELSAYAAALLPQNALFQPVCEFSGGMKRRLSLLRALLVPFDLLILDEPFNGLDS